MAEICTLNLARPDDRAALRRRSDLAIEQAVSGHQQHSFAGAERRP